MVHQQKRGEVELTNKYIRLTTKPRNIEHIIFYKDIIDIKKGKKCIRVSSKSDKYTMVLYDSVIIEETYVTILEKISECQ